MADLFPVNRTPGRRAADVETGWASSWVVARNVLIVAAVVGALWLVYQLGTLILLIIFSLLFAYLIEPLVEFVQRRITFGRGRQLSPAVAIFITYLVVFGVVGLVIAWVAPKVFEQVSEVAKRAPERVESARANGEPFRSVYGHVEQLGLSPTLVQHGVSTITSAIVSGARGIGEAFLRLAAYVPWLVLIPILAFFLLKDATSFRTGALGFVPAGKRHHAEEVLDRIDAALAAYIRAQLVACLIVGAIVGVGLTVLRVPYAAVLGVVAGLAEFVPLIGPLVIAAVAAVVAAMHAPMLAVWVLVFLGVVRVLEDYVIYPRLIGSNIHLHPLAVIIAVLAGAELGGAVGVLLSVPVLAVVLSTYRYYVESRGGENRTPHARPA